MWSKGLIVVFMCMLCLGACSDKKEALEVETLEVETLGVETLVQETNVEPSGIGEPFGQATAIRHFYLDCDIEEGSIIYVPCLTLTYADRFSFGYDMLNSYLSIGTYKVVDDRYILTTDDNKYKYEFKKTEDGLIFDAANSSEVKLINSDMGIEDGDLFIER